MVSSSSDINVLRSPVSLACPTAQVLDNLPAKEHKVVTCAMVERQRDMYTKKLQHIRSTSALSTCCTPPLARPAVLWLLSNLYLFKSTGKSVHAFQLFIPANWFPDEFQSLLSTSHSALWCIGLQFELTGFC